MAINFKAIPEVTLSEAQKYADMVQKPVHIHRRGFVYITSQHARKSGWSNVQTVQPGEPKKTVKVDYALSKKAHVFTGDKSQPCTACGLVRGAECHGFYSHLEVAL